MGFNEGGGNGGNYGRCRSGGNSGRGRNYGSGGRCELHRRFVGGGSSQRDSEFLERGLKIEIKNFAKGVAGEAIKTFGKV